MRTANLSMNKVQTAACGIVLALMLGSTGVVRSDDGLGGGAEANATSISTSDAAASAGAISAPMNITETSLQNTNTSMSTLDLDQTFEAGKFPPPAVTGVLPAISTPQIFQSPTVPQFGKGVPLALVYYEQCNPVLKGDANLKEQHQRGASGNTDVIFLPHPSYFTGGEEGASVDSVSVSFPQKPEKVKCLGILTVNARKKDADEVTMYSAVNDAQHFAKAKLQGFTDVALLCAQNAVAVNIGIRNRGMAAGVSPGVNYITGSVRSLYSLLGGVTGQSAETFPSAQMGFSCIVAASGDDTIVNLTGLNQTLNHMLEQNGNSNIGIKAYGSGTNNRQ